MGDADQDRTRTYHLVARDDWEALEPGEDYVPASLSAEGFIYCTDGVDEVVATGNRYYRDDPRLYLVLAIAPSLVSAPIRCDDPERRYPHVYGALNRDAVESVRPAPRAPDGTFLPQA